MKVLPQFIVLIVFSLLIISCANKKEADQSSVKAEAHKSVEVQYDSLLALKYGADQYGMRKYVMAFLHRGPNRDLDSAAAAKLQMAHMENIGRMANEGKLALAGPFFGDGDLRGIYIFNVESIDEAEALTNTDPAIQQGSLKMDLMEWYGSAGLMAVNELHKKISKQEVIK